MLSHTGRIFIAALILIVSFLPPALSADGRGVLEIQIKDHREAIGDFASLMLKLDKVRISPEPRLLVRQVSWRELTPSPAAVDLTQYVGKKAVRIFRGELETGAFDALDLRIKSIDAQLKKNRRPTAVKNTIGPVKIAFQVPLGGETLLVIDLVVTDLSDHPPRGYELGINGYELYTNGKLIGKIPPG
jgi:hypothetical protein